MSLTHNGDKMVMGEEFSMADRSQIIQELVGQERSRQFNLREWENMRRSGKDSDIIFKTIPLVALWMKDCGSEGGQGRKQGDGLGTIGEVQIAIG